MNNYKTISLIINISNESNILYDVNVDNDNLLIRIYKNLTNVEITNIIIKTLNINIIPKISLNASYDNTIKNDIIREKNIYNNGIGSFSKNRLNNNHLYIYVLSPYFYNFLSNKLYTISNWDFKYIDNKKYNPKCLFINNSDNKCNESICQPGKLYCVYHDAYITQQDDYDDYDDYCNKMIISEYFIYKKLIVYEIFNENICYNLVKILLKYKLNNYILLLSIENLSNPNNISNNSTILNNDELLYLCEHIKVGTVLKFHLAFGEYFETITQSKFYTQYIIDNKNQVPFNIIYNNTLANNNINIYDDINIIYDMICGLCKNNCNINDTYTILCDDKTKIMHKFNVNRKFQICLTCLNTIHKTKNKCLVCLNDNVIEHITCVNMNDFDNFTSNDHHSICIDCFIQYVTYKMNDGCNPSKFTSCIDSNCNRNYCIQYLYKFLPLDFIKKYDEKIQIWQKSQCLHTYTCPMCREYIDCQLQGCEYETPKKIKLSRKDFVNELQIMYLNGHHNPFIANDSNKLKQQGLLCGDIILSINNISTNNITPQEFIFHFKKSNFDELQNNSDDNLYTIDVTRTQDSYTFIQLSRKQILNIKVINFNELSDILMNEPDIMWYYNDIDKINQMYCRKCEKSWCTNCNKEVHGLKDCNIINSIDDVNKIVQTLLSNILIRKCPKCKIAYIKSEGCNLIICQYCSTPFCNLCMEIVPKQKLPDGTEIQYYHFKGSGTSNKYSRCPLYDDNNSANIIIKSINNNIEMYNLININDKNNLIFKALIKKLKNQGFSLKRKNINKYNKGFINKIKNKFITYI